VDFHRFNQRVFQQNRPEASVCCVAAIRPESGVKPTCRDCSSDAVDPFRTLADCDASRFEDDILAAWYCYQSAKRLFLPELPGQERAPPEVRNFV
jgi:hypothetical protein